MDAGESGEARPVRVLVVTPTGREGRGGIDRLYAYLREEAARGGMPGIALDFFAARGPVEGRRSALTFPFRVVAFAARLARGDVDVVHLNHSTHGSAGRKAVLALVARLFRRPVVTHFHGLVASDDRAANPLWLRLLGAMSRRADRVIVLGRAFVPFFEGMGVARERIAVVPNGIPDFSPVSEHPLPSPLRGRWVGEAGSDGGRDVGLKVEEGSRPVREPLPASRPPPPAPPRKGEGSAPLILFAGEVGTRKGVDMLIPALARLAVGGAWRCVIAGNGDVERYAALAREHGLMRDQGNAPLPLSQGERVGVRGVTSSEGSRPSPSPAARPLPMGEVMCATDRVSFTGWLSSADTHALMREAAIVVLPSRIEGLPLTLIEGACAGAALVASDVGAIPDVVREGENGCVVPLEPEAIAQALATLLADPERLAAMGAASRALYEREFGIAVLARRLAALYVELARRPSARSWLGSRVVPPSRSTSAMPP